jgi:hypothetical protein
LIGRLYPTHDSRPTHHHFQALPRSHNFKKSQITANHKPIRYFRSPQVKVIHYTMAPLQSFMSYFLSQCHCSSIYIVSDNARIPQQQQQQQAAPSGPVSPRHFDYKGTTRWDSVEVMPPGLSPPVRQTSDDDPVYPARASAHPAPLNRTHSLP